MNIYGRWELFAAPAPAKNGGIEYLTKENYAKLPYPKGLSKRDLEMEKRERYQLLNTIVEISNDKMKMYAPIPEGISQEEVDAAVASGEVKIYDGKWIDDGSETEIKVDGGKVYYKADDFEFNGEKIEWLEIQFSGSIMMYQFFQFKKVEE